MIKSQRIQTDAGRVLLLENGSAFWLTDFGSGQLRSTMSDAEIALFRELMKARETIEVLNRTINSREPIQAPSK
jgi:hypothetical protein